MKKRIKAIMPYSGLMKTLEELSNTYQQFYIDAVEIADIDVAVEVALNAQYAGYDAILSRGNTSLAIQEKVSIPVFSIEVTGLDTVRIFRMIDGFSGKWAFVGYPHIMKMIQSIYTVLHSEAVIRIINSPEECREAICELKQQGVTMIVGDAFTMNMAATFGMNTTLITSGYESVKQTLEQMAFFFRHMDDGMNRIMLYQEVMNKSPRHTLVFDSDKHLVMKSGEHAEELAQIVQPLVNNWDGVHAIHSMVQRGNELWQVESRRLDGRDMQYTGYLAVFCNLVKNAESILRYQKNGCLKIIRSAKEKTYTSEPLSSRSPTIQTLCKELSAQKEFSSPLLFLAEPGLDTDHFVDLFYGSCPLAENAMLIIDCAMLSEADWDAPLQEEDSPLRKALREKAYIFYLKNLHELSKNAQIALLDSLRNRQGEPLHIIAQAATMQSLVNSKTFSKELFYELSPVVLSVPPLRERMEDMEDYCKQYFLESNIVNGTNIADMESEALAYIKQYDWPGNMEQLKKAIMRIAREVQRDIVTSSVVKRVIDSFSEKDYTGTLPVSLMEGTLEEIESDIIKSIYLAENENATKAAKRLGISRSTLWRKLYRNGQTITETDRQR